MFLLSMYLLCKNKKNYDSLKRLKIKEKKNSIPFVFIALLHVLSLCC